MPFFHKEEKFDKHKAKTSLKMAVTRLNMQKNKKENQLKLQKREIANLLNANKNESARIKVEAVIRDAYMIEALELLTLFLDLLATRLQLIVESKTCPPDMKEAVSTVIWAAPRVENVPELLTFRQQVANKFGREFALAASDNSEMAVNPKVHERMSMLVPEPYLCIETLKDIAQQFDVDWDYGSCHVEIPSSGLGSGVANMPDPNSSAARGVDGAPPDMTGLGGLPVPPVGNPHMAPTHNPNFDARGLSGPPSDPSGGPSMGYGGGGAPPMAPQEPDLLGPQIGGPQPPIVPQHNNITPGGPPDVPPEQPYYNQQPPGGYGAPPPAAPQAPPPSDPPAGDFSDLEARLDALKKGHM